MIQLTSDTLVSEKDLIEDLSLQQRIILHNGGSLTKLMEVMMDEELVLNKIHEEVRPSRTDIDELDIRMGDTIMRRRITLQGAESKINHIYADSIIAIDNLDQEFSDALLKTNIPIGKIWELLRVETYKKMMRWGDLKAGKIAPLFKIAPYETLLFRTYQVCSQRKPIMLITEQFPMSWYKDSILEELKSLKVKVA